ncbi:MAG: UDP-glucose 4-epimerase GalE [Deferribacteraceae bacterium]|jgi:UDP-glucose 4-epimerase|nr:UDP-glucose 4-epimerase GalE [Deferribacteraceae bacterium]
MKNILIVGGAGYIGSHAVVNLQESGYNCIVLDNLSEGYRDAVKCDHFVQGDINDTNVLNYVFQSYDISTVMHFSAYINVGESVVDPQKYYKNNVQSTLNLLSAMVDNKVKNFIFSSTCAIFGNPQYLPLDEDHPQAPINPYGMSKFMVEKILEDYSKAYNLKYVALRYFNAAGAHPTVRIGENHRIETHLIPLVLKTLTGERKDIKIFGTDYDTPDGTCVRDYIHVCDLAEAHKNAIELLDAGNESYQINLGTGVGHSVKEIIAACEEVTGMRVPVVNAPRRAGDPASLVATSGGLAKRLLNFNPKFIDIRETIRTAWDWERNKEY